MKLNLELHWNWRNKSFSTNECGSYRGEEFWEGRMFHFPFGILEVEFLKN
jgi:hypothetical protein